MATAAPITGIPITIPGLPTQIIPLPPGVAPLTPAELAIIEREVVTQINAALPTALSDLQTGISTGDFTKFNLDVGNLVQQILADAEQFTHPPCFSSGTLICTDRGEILVQDLLVGDLAVTSSGVNVPVKWLGHRIVECRRHPRPHEVMPVRISAHAFGNNRPSRDLRVSPGHSICIDVLGEVLIPASCLINNATIVQETVDQVTYWHVELEGGHNIILAENMPTESYMEMGNRSFFAEGDLVSLSGIPDAPIVTHDDFCRPFYVGGPLVDALRLRLMSRVADLGWHHEVSDLATCRLVVDGVSIAPKLRDMSLLFKLPAGASEVWMESSVGVPAEIFQKSTDLRPLGILVKAINVGDGYSSVTIAPDDPRLSTGFHNAEMIDGAPQRWTMRRAALPSSLWEGMEDNLFLRIDVGSNLLPKWANNCQMPKISLAA